MPDQPLGGFRWLPQGLYLSTSHARLYAVLNAHLIFPPQFSVFPSLHREFGDFPLNICFLKFNMMWGFLFVFPYFYWFKSLPLNFWDSKNFPSTKWFENFPSTFGHFFFLFFLA
jgi:hypothetical protein